VEWNNVPAGDDAATKTVTKTLAARRGVVAQLSGDNAGLPSGVAWSGERETTLGNLFTARA